MRAIDKGEVNTIPPYEKEGLTMHSILIHIVSNKRYLLSLGIITLSEYKEQMSNIKQTWGLAALNREEQRK